MNPSAAKGEAKRPAGRRPWTLAAVILAAALAGFFYLNQSPQQTPAQANEGNAIDSLHSILGAEDQYRNDFPAVGYACSLSALGGDPNAGPPTPQSGKLLPGGLPSGRDSGYIFSIRNCSKQPNTSSSSAANISKAVSTFEITAVPQTIGKSGQRGFCMDQTGEIRVDPSGGAHCTEPLE